jgi:membrane protein YdbS with pleckstrin-like domain
MIPSQAIPPAVKGYLLPDERRVITIRRHPGQLLKHVGLLACALAAASLLTAVADSSPPLLAAAWVASAFILLYVIVRGIEWLCSYVVVTEARLMFIRGPFIRKVTTLPLREIRDLEFKRSPAARVFGYGEFTLQAARSGHPMPTMKYMPYPEQLYLEVTRVLFPGEAGD